MCLAIPGKVVEVRREHALTMGKVDFGGVSKQVCLECIQQPVVGDYVLVHAGFALTRIDESEARQVFEFLERMQELEEFAAPARPAAQAPQPAESSRILATQGDDPPASGVRP